MAASDTFSSVSVGISSSAPNIFVITQSDSTDLPYVTRAINAAADCVAKITTDGGETITGYQLHKGYNPIRVARVWDTGTDAVSLWGLY
jgi:hypothetical protein